MENKFEMMPEPVQPEDVPEDVDNTTKEAEEIVTEEQEPKLEDEVVSNSEKHNEEMDKEEEKVAAEIESNFRESLALLHVRIQLRKTPEKEFPDKKELTELLEEIGLFSQMELGAKKMFLTALDKDKDLHSEDEEEFIDKGMKVLDILVHTAILKKGGDAWLGKKAEERGNKN
ncbi:MAG: hypothetical protein HQ539_01330 [Parcubacteria group bacterium]|nr:hypothetical protein [Parcubacteria group bacterium]